MRLRSERASCCWPSRCCDRVAAADAAADDVGRDAARGPLREVRLERRPGRPARRGRRQLAIEHVERQVVVEVAVVVGARGAQLRLGRAAACRRWPCRCRRGAACGSSRRCRAAPLGIAARPGMSGAVVGMPAVTNVRVRRLRTLTLMRWREALAAWPGRPGARGRCPRACRLRLLPAPAVEHVEALGLPVGGLLGLDAQQLAAVARPVERAVVVVPGERGRLRARRCRAPRSRSPTTASRRRARAPRSARATATPSGEQRGRAGVGEPQLLEPQEARARAAPAARRAGTRPRSRARRPAPRRASPAARARRAGSRCAPRRGQNASSAASDDQHRAAERDHESASTGRCRGRARARRAARRCRGRCRRPARPSRSGRSSSSATPPAEQRERERQQADDGDRRDHRAGGRSAAPAPQQPDHREQRRAERVPRAAGAAGSSITIQCSDAERGQREERDAARERERQQRAGGRSTCGGAGRRRAPRCAAPARCRGAR